MSWWYCETQKAEKTHLLSFPNVLAIVRVKADSIEKAWNALPLKASYVYKTFFIKQQPGLKVDFYSTPRCWTFDIGQFELEKTLYTTKYSH